MTGNDRDDIEKRAERLEDEGEWHEATELYRSLVLAATDETQGATFRLAVARCLLGGGNPEEAEEWLADAEAAAHSCAAPASVLASVAIQQGVLAEYQGRLTKMRDRYVEARALLETADEDLSEVRLLVAHAEIRLGDIDAAVDQLLLLDPPKLEPEYRAGFLDAVGLVLLARGEAFAATKVLEKAVALDEQVEGNYIAAHSRLLLARALLRSGNRRRAKKLLDDVLDTYAELHNARDLSEVHALFGLLYEDSGKYAQAIQSYRDGFNQDIRSDDPVGHAIAQRSLGRVYMKRGIHEQAREYFESARNMLATVDDRVELTKLLVEEASLLLAENDYDKAIRTFEEALRLAEQTEDDRRVAIVKRCLASALREDGQVERSVSLLQEARAELKGESGDPIEKLIDELISRAGVSQLEKHERGDLRELEELLDDLGEALVEQGNYEEAMEALSESAELDKLLETPLESQARSLVLLGRAQARRGERREARRAYETAMELYEEGDDEVGQSEARFYLGRWFMEEGRFREALKQFRKGLRIDQQKSDRVNVARALRAIASVYRRLGDLNRASEHIEEAREALGETDDPAERGELELESARISISRDDLRLAAKALDCARENLATSEVGSAMCDHVAARLAFAEGSYTRALTSLDRARELFERKKDMPELDDLFDDIGEVQLAAGELDSARKAVEHSLELGKAMGWSSGRGRSLLLLSRIAMASHDNDGARRFLRDAVQAFEDDEVGMSEAKTLSGELYEREQDLNRAIEELKDARRLDQEHGDLRGLADCNRRLARIYQRRQEWMRAEEALEQAEDQLEHASAPRELALVQVDFGEYWLHQGDAKEALRRFNKALPVIETIPNGKRELSRLYSLIINAHQAGGDLAAALQVMKRAEMERSSVWGAVLWDLHPELVEVTEEKYARGDYQGAVVAGYQLVEDRLRERFVKFSDGEEKHVPIRELAKRALVNTPELRDLVLAAFGFIRNPIAHSPRTIGGVEALGGVFVAHLILSAFSTDPPSPGIVEPPS
jgi:tetratricopeptide (TPR) repeat protein